MLTLDRKAWVAAITTSMVVFATGLFVATNAHTPQPDLSPSRTELTAQPRDNCPTNDYLCLPGTENPSPSNPSRGSGGGSTACTYDTGDGTITVADDSRRRGIVRLAQYGVIEIPCYMEGYGWYDGGNCYVGDPPALVQPPLVPPEGADPDSGAWYWLRCFAGITLFNGEPVFYWYADMRWRWIAHEDAPSVTPEQVARSWLAAIRLEPVQLQLAPPPGSGAGLVGLPVWLGVDTSDPNSWGPISDRHCIAGVCVSLSAQVTEVTWNMGDGTTFTCARGTHHTWQRGMDFRSPTGCHHFYQRSSRHQPGGHYTLTATSHWEVEWSGLSASGVMTVERTATTSVQIDEIQVLTTR